MTIEPEPPEDADPADVAAQLQDLDVPTEDDEAPEPQPSEVPLEANEADVAEQRTDIPGGADDDFAMPEP